MLQKTKILNLLEETFAKDTHTFTSTEWSKVVNKVLYNIEFGDYDYKKHRGTYSCALYRYNTEYFFNSSKREPRYISKVSRGVYEIHGKANPHTPKVKVADEVKYELIMEYPGSLPKGTILIKIQGNRFGDNRSGNIITLDLSKYSTFYKLIPKPLETYECEVIITKVYKLSNRKFASLEEANLFYEKIFIPTTPSHTQKSFKINKV